MKIPISALFQQCLLSTMPSGTVFDITFQYDGYEAKTKTVTGTKEVKELVKMIKGYAGTIVKVISYYNGTAKDITAKYNK